MGKPATIKVAWVLCGAICAFTAENVWIGPWVARRSHNRLPSLVPEALGGTWFLALMGLLIGVILAVVCQILLMRDPRPARWQKALTGVAVLSAVALTAEWVVATGGITLPRQTHAQEKKHTVLLRWQASTTKSVSYNVYRGTVPGNHPVKVNDEPLDGLSFVDKTVESGKDYYYVTRAVNAKGRESKDSNETWAHVP